MNFSEFVGEVQHRLELPGEGEAVRATRAVLGTLGQRLTAGEADDLASSLPMEIDYYPRHVDHEERFDFDEFVDRVTEITGADRADAYYYGQVVVAIVSEVTPGSEINQVRGQLPEEFDELFELVDRPNGDDSANQNGDTNQNEGANQNGNDDEAIDGDGG